MKKDYDKNMTQTKYQKKVKYGVAIAVSLLLPAVLFYLLECYTQNPFEKVRPWAQFFNIILFELIAGLLFFMTGKVKTALRVETLVTMIFGLANAYVVRFRTNPIVPWDIFSWRTAASVADNYDFMPDKRMVIVTLLLIAIFVGVRLIKLEITRVAFWKRLIPAAVVMTALCLFVNTLQQEDFQNRYRLYNKLFTPVFMTDADGIAVTFAMNLAYMSIEKPQQYSVETVEELLRQYEDETVESVKTEELPNVIVVMNEAFSDLSVLGGFTASEDYMPFLHSLQQGAENTVTGMLNVSVCGGNTANTEFEFLTGNTMAFLPQGSIPYQQYIKGELPSLANDLREMGYQTVATHPYHASGWERDTVYPWMGFSETIFLDGYSRAYDVRQYVGDAGCVEKIQYLYETKEEGQPLFVFNVTMQNHGGYQDAYPNFTPSVRVNGVENFSVEQYLSLIKLSDESLKELVEYFSEVDEKTVVVFFGDHQPNDVVAAPILALNGMAWNQLDEEALKLRYQVPYVIWANYDIEEAQNADTSANYLAAEVLKRAGIPTNAYQNFLLDLKETYPILSAMRTVRANGSETPASEEGGRMDDYRRLQYYELFDRGGRE